MQTLKNLATITVSLTLVGCTSVNPSVDYARIQQHVENTTGYSQLHNPENLSISNEQIDQMLNDGLTKDEAVDLALLNNRSLQAELSSIGVAKADWVQSGLLRNPTVGVEILLPEGGGRSQVAASIAQNILDLWQLPIRKQIAQHKLDAAVLLIARTAGELAIDTQKQYYEAVAATELLQFAEESIELFERSHKATGDKREAGTASSFEENLAHGQLLTGQLDLRAAHLEALNSKRRLARILSLERDGADLKLTDVLPDIVLSELDEDQLIKHARQARLDLRSYEAIIRAASVNMSLEKNKAFGEVEAGVGFERNERRGGDGNGIDEKVGPIITLEIPIFDQNQAQVARRFYIERGAIKTYEAASLAIAQEIRMAISVAGTAVDSVNFFKEKLLPQTEQNLEFADSGYRGGQLTILGLIESQRSALEARQAFIKNRTIATLSLLELERVIGTPIQQIDTAVLNH